MMGKVKICGELEDVKRFFDALDVTTDYVRLKTLDGGTAKALRVQMPGQTPIQSVNNCVEVDVEALVAVIKARIDWAYEECMIHAEIEMEIEEEEEEMLEEEDE